MKKELMTGLAWAGGILAVALAATSARKLGYIDGETVKRVVAMNGLMIAWYGNRIPKAFSRCATARQAQRVAGWSMVLSGLLYAALWAFAPIPIATTVATTAIAAGVAVTLGYCLMMRAGPKAA